MSKEKNYNFFNGRLNGNFSHDNVGKYTLHIEDINWTHIDKNETNLGCIIGSSSNIAINGKFGCNIASDEGDRFFDVKMSFQPYKFAFKDTLLSNINGNGKDYLYMSDLTRSTEMGLNLHSTLVAEGENGTKLTNFTKGCMAKEVKLSSEFTVLYDPNIAEHNSSEKFTLLSTNGSVVKPQNILRVNNDNNSQLANFNNLTLAKDNFLDTNEGNVTVDILYNMQKNFNDSTNPIKVNFLTLDANATNIKTKVSNKNRVAKGEEAISNGNRIFYFARVASIMNKFPETNRQVIKTPLYVEIYCKVLGNRNWCDNTMKLNNIGRNTSKTDNGWYLAKEHNSSVDGKVTELKSNNENIVLENVTPVEDFIEGKVDNINVRYSNNNKPIDGKYKATIDITSDIWLGFNTNVLKKNSSYSVTFKGISNETGVGKRGYMLKQRPQIDRNGKMSW
jgi:hypothetical protein